MKKMPIVEEHTHGELESDGESVIGSHHENHETGGLDALTAIAAEIVTTGTLDGDRLPAISATKKGAVPAVTAGATELLAKWLKDTGLFERIVQANCDGLKTTDTPQFAGLGIGVAGVANSAELAEGATIGDASGPQIKYNKAAELIEVLDADLNVGSTPTQPGTGGTWAISYESAEASIREMCVFNGKLYAASSNANGKLYVYNGTAWSEAYDFGDGFTLGLVVHNGKLYAGGGTSTTARVWSSSNGTTWAEVSQLPTGNSARVLLSYDGLLWAAGQMESGRLYYSVDNGANWTLAFTPNPSSYHTRALINFNGDYYVGITTASDSTGAAYIYSNVSGSWAIVHTVTAPGGFYSSFIWNGKLYFGGSEGRLYSTSNGTDWAEHDFGNGSIYGIIEHDAKLLVCVADIIYQSEDGESWTEFYDAPSGIYVIASFGGNLYIGDSAGDIYAYTDNTYVPAPNLKVFGHMTGWGQWRPGDAAGVEGDILLSGGAAHPSWLARGDTGEYLAGVTGGKPVYKVIPASDVTFGPNSYTEATDVQAAIEEVQNDCLTRAKVTIKIDTGDPASGEEGEICINTFDNTVKIYAEAAWRQLATW